MIIDEAVISIEAGNGGDGAVSFRREKYVPKGGPDGGNGGNGGNMFFVGVADLGALRRFRHQKEFSAQAGGAGQSKKQTGKNGQDLTLSVPVGTVIIDEKTAEQWEFIQVGQKELIATGGKGGRGNWHFRSPSNTTPRQFEQGGNGQQRKLAIELRLIADVGFIGLPNAGKSSLLNELTRASVHVAAYPFTTLEPNLGALGSLILADIPGLIAGASTGRGLGYKFLRHIRRTRILAHCISLESADLLHDYEVVRTELQLFDKTLLDKPELVVLTKADLISAAQQKACIQQFKKLKVQVITCSIHDSESLDILSGTLMNMSGKFTQ